MIAVRTFTAHGRPLDTAEAEDMGCALYAAYHLLREASLHGAGHPTVSFYDADDRLIVGGLRRINASREGS